MVFAIRQEGNARGPPSGCVRHGEELTEYLGGRPSIELYAEIVHTTAAIALI